MTDATATDTPPPAKSKAVPLFLIINSVLLAAVLGVLLLKPAAAPAAAQPKEEHGGAEGGKEAGPGPGGIGPTLRLADFVVHLRNPEVDRYARLSFEIELANDKDKDSLNPHLPKVREAFIAYLSDRTLEELRGSDGIEKTKEALLAKLKVAVPSVTPRAIYITDIVIQ